MMGGDGESFGDLSDDEEARDALADELGRLTGKAMFTVAEFAAATVTIFEVFRDLHGTPTAYKWEYLYEGGAFQSESADRWSEAIADPEGFYRHVAPKFIVRTSRELPDGLRGLLPGPGEVPV